MKRVLVFNYFAGVMDRGIPAYAQDIATCMRRLGMDVIELRCPRLLRRAPRMFQNLMFVFFEQVVAPSMRLLRGCSLTVYPYNSAGIIDAALGRSVLVIHDLIPNRRGNLQLSSKYIRVTQTIHRMLARQICSASSHTLAQLHRLPAFRDCALRLWSNPFYAFAAALGEQRLQVPAGSPRPLRVLLCTGMGPNKDYAGALKLFRKSKLLAEAELRIFGFGDDAALARRRLSRMPEHLQNRIRVLPRLSLAEVATEYTSADLVWVHSRKEGFGRCVVEGLLSGRAVIASDIGAFRELLGTGVFLYGKNGFDASIAHALSERGRATMTFENCHLPLEASVREVIAEYS
jgi:glycosyltransferase involved in cell wall biosynthesis